VRAGRVRGFPRLKVEVLRLGLTQNTGPTQSKEMFTVEDCGESGGWLRLAHESAIVRCFPTHAFWHGWGTRLMNLSVRRK